MICLHWGERVEISSPSARLDAIECLISGDDVDTNVGLDVGFRRGDNGFEEGLFVCFRVNDEEISLKELHTTYSQDVGSDHFTVDCARLHPAGHFSEQGVEQWLEQLQEIRVQDDAALTVSRDHI